MALHRITLQMASPSGTAWLADTFFGHLCWALAYLEGASELTQLLEASSGPEPPLVLSDGFPGDLLPRPAHLPPPALVTRQAPAEKKSPDPDQQDYEARRKLKKRRWFTLDEFNDVLQARPLDPNTDPPEKTKTYSSWDLDGKWRVTFRNTIRRDIVTTGGPGEGGLHPHHSFHWPSVTFYARLGPGMPPERLQRLLTYLEASGYGKERSRGFGWIRSAKLDPTPFTGFSPPQDANGFVSLSTFVPAESDPTDGAWQVLVKYGKVSEGFSAIQHPFKRPLVMLERGALFRTPGPSREWYGRMVDDVYPDDPRVKQHGLALAIPIRYPLE